jgi:G3E family GTPase
MAAEIYVISGFLGAGKTTLIQKLLKEAFRNEKIVLIENDFGDISVDAALLKTSGIEVKEMNSGCICCSLSGDFIKALKELLDRYHPDKIIIEPSGVGKLSDVVKVCADPRIQPYAKIARKVTVADVKRCQMYLDNFGEFFEDQIKNADVILLSRTDIFPDKVAEATRLIKSLNTHAIILSKPLTQLNPAEILYPKEVHRAHTEHCGHGHGCSCGHHHDHDHTCDGSHKHSADDVFDTVTIRTTRTFNKEDLMARVANMERSTSGTILRAKGIVRGSDGYMNLQYLPGDIQITKCAASGDMLCIIGRNLNRQELCTLFRGE